jgi:phage terminase large subunit-like protein
MNPLDLLAALVLEDGQLWGAVAEPWQWDLAHWLIDPDGTPNRWESRPRGGSKSTDIAALLIVVLLCLLRPGSRCYCIAVDKDQGALIIDAAAGFLARTPELSGQIDVGTWRISSFNGSTVEVLPADAASAWGLRPSVVVADELCQWPGTRNAKGLWQAVVSALGKVQGARLLTLSTSGDPGHWSRRIYDAAQQSPAWTVADVPGPLPWASEEFLAEQRLILPESVYRRLHLNEWCAPEDRLTNVDDVQACVAHTGPLAPVDGFRYVIGVDLGVTNDRTVCAVMHAERAESGPEVRRMVLDRLEVWTPSRGNPVDLTAVEDWVRTAARQYRAKVIVDPYQAIAMVQRLRATGIRIEEFTFSQASIGRLAMALHTTIRDHRLALPDDEELIDELVNVRLRQTSPNVYRLDHDPDRHDDRAIAMSLAVLDLTTQPASAGEVVFFDSEPTALDGRPLQVLNGPFAMRAEDSLTSHLEQFGDAR